MQTFIVIFVVVVVAGVLLNMFSSFFFFVVVVVVVAAAVFSLYREITPDPPFRFELNELVGTGDQIRTPPGAQTVAT